MAAYFITGSGTDLGKTFVTAGLLRALRAQGRAADALKPVVSGFDPSAPEGSDPAVLLEALGRPPTTETLQKIAPWRFRAPLSPDMAAALEGRTIDLDEVAGFCQAAVAAAPGVMLIEGAGGVMVPLNQRETTLDLMAALKLPLIFVAGSYLGAISHALTGLEAMRARELEARAIIVNETSGSSVTLAATRETLAHFTAAPLLSLRFNDPAANNAAFAALAAQL
ncbi:dethiobiotin synthase [Methylocella silvestris BL2]|uniref:ATP-dependent dethiobiotin synthetase BioD n=1 Tax=Methylocella silvestris (strain DSM 15510 / CIP 108128 / LMG 27833 / NCIMB 13906 / BL2) TaxID=395965 RepID=B8ERM0_METSB|nr:dethiobiotin synthase [Methylocella silvestris]ACK51072.1 dethiobiotin synthase [Methylocella silvestris BL2]